MGREEASVPHCERGFTPRQKRHESREEFAVSHNGHRMKSRLWMKPHLGRMRRVMLRPQHERRKVYCDHRNAKGPCSPLLSSPTRCHAAKPLVSIPTYTYLRVDPSYPRIATEKEQCRAITRKYYSLQKASTH